MKEFMKRKPLFSIFLVLCVVFVGCFGVGLGVEASKVVKCKKITLDVSKATVEVNGVITVTPTLNPSNCTQNVKWSTSNKDVATVNDCGTITGVKAGSATITAKCGSKKATCSVTVKTNYSKKDIQNIIQSYMQTTNMQSIIQQYGTAAIQQYVQTDAYKNQVKQLAETVAQQYGISSDAVMEILGDANNWDTDMIEAVLTNDDWEDGTEVACLNDLSGDNTVVFNNIGGKDISLTIDSASVKKWHNDTDVAPYKYVLTVHGTASGNDYSANKDKIQTMDMYCYIGDLVTVDQGIGITWDGDSFTVNQEFYLYDDEYAFALADPMNLLDLGMIDSIF